MPCPRAFALRYACFASFAVLAAFGSLTLDTYADEPAKKLKSIKQEEVVAHLVVPQPLDDISNESGAIEPGIPAMLLENKVYQALITGGIASASGQQISLPKALVSGSVSTSPDFHMIEPFAMPERMRARFFRQSTASPTVLSIHEAKPKGVRTRLYHVDIMFVVFGGIKLIESDAFLWGLGTSIMRTGATDKDFKSRFLTSNDLRKRGIQLRGADDRVIHNRIKVWDRLVVSTTSHVEVTRDENSVLTAAILDSRFVDDPEFPAHWQPVHRDNVGRLEYGQPQPYCRGGFYFRLTELCDPAGAVLVEYHQLFEEPREWFGGANLLRSKLPLLVPLGVQYFRGQLELAAKRKSSPTVLFR